LDSRVLGQTSKKFERKIVEDRSDRSQTQLIGSAIDE
jgi:hypothetical protein